MATFIRSLVMASVTTAAAVMLSAAPAVAGGVVVIGSPSSDNTCTNQHSGGRGTTASSPAHASGNALQLPATAPLNHCGGADLPLNTSGRAWPDFCHPAPKPEANWFATNSEIVPCQRLTKAMFSMVKKKQVDWEAPVF